MKVKVIDVWSGFSNVPNSVILAENYGGNAAERPGSAYDTEYTIELPDGYELAEMFGGGRGIFYNGHHVELASVNQKGRYVTGVSIDGFFEFPAE